MIYTKYVTYKNYVAIKKQLSYFTAAMFRSLEFFIASKFPIILFTPYIYILDFFKKI